jgi:hypothetical protein
LSEAVQYRVLRMICGPKREQVMGDWRKLQSEELHDLYSSPNITWVITRLRFVGLVECMGKKSTYRILVSKPQGKRPLGRSMHRRDDY